MSDIQCVDDTGDPTQDGQADVDEEVGAASAFQEDTQRRQDEGEEDLADVAVVRGQPNPVWGGNGTLSRG